MNVMLAFRPSERLLFRQWTPYFMLPSMGSDHVFNFKTTGRYRISASPNCLIPIIAILQCLKFTCVSFLSFLRSSHAYLYASYWDVPLHPLQVRVHISCSRLIWKVGFELIPGIFFRSPGRFWIMCYVGYVFGKVIVIDMDTQRRWVKWTLCILRTVYVW